MELKLPSLILLISLASTGLTQTTGGGTSTSTSTSTSTGTSTTTPPSGGGGGSPPSGGAGGYDYPPPPHGGGGGGPGGFPGGFGGGFPFFPGFFKNFDFNVGAGYGPFGGLGGGFPGGFGGGFPGIGGGFGGPPPGEDPELDGGLFDGFGGGFPGFGGGFGGFGPSYVPATWIGSALGAKGDLLFPIVIFVFFVVGVWTVIQLLLAFIVPLIAKKIAITAPLKGGLLLKRDVNEQIAGSNAVSPDLDFITNSVLDAINEPKCLKYVACHSGKFLNSMNGDAQRGSYYDGILKALSNMTKSDAMTVFEEAFVQGASMDCNKFTCDKTVDAHNHESSSNATDPKANEVH